MKTLKILLLGLSFVTMVNVQAQTREVDPNTETQAMPYRWTQETRKGSGNTTQVMENQIGVSFSDQFLIRIFGQNTWQVWSGLLL